MSNNDKLTINALDSVRRETSTQQELNALLDATNQASGAARSTWVFFVGMMAYFFVTIATISHKDLLLNGPITLPVLNVSISLNSFFGYAPLVLLLIHFWVLIQHVMLARKVKALDEVLNEIDGQDHQRSLFFRLQLHAYFFTQVLADPPRSFLTRMSLKLMLWLTLLVLPTFLFIGFQIGFLAYHDPVITWAHRFYLLMDVLLLLGVGLLLRNPDASFVTSVSDMPYRRPMSSLGAFAATLSVLFFSFCLATIPDSRIDKAMTKLWPAELPLDWNGSDIPLSGRLAFWPTAYLFEHKIFSRNLKVNNEDLVSDLKSDPDDVSIRLNGRDLRYANFIDSDLHRANFSGADLTGTKFRRANLQKTKFTKKTIIKRANFVLANMQHANMEGVRATESNFNLAKFHDANLQDAVLIGNRFEVTDFSGANLLRAKLVGVKANFAKFMLANLHHADFRGARLSAAKFQGADLNSTEFMLAGLSGANFQGTTLKYTGLQGANLSGARLQGASLKTAHLGQTNFISRFPTRIWKTQLRPETVEQHKKQQNGFAGIKIAALDDKERKKIQEFLDGIENEKHAEKLKQILEPLLAPEPENESESWTNSENYKLWKQLENYRPDPDKLGEYLADLACNRYHYDNYFAKDVPYSLTSLLYQRPSRIESEFLRDIKKCKHKYYDKLTKTQKNSMDRVVRQVEKLKKKQAQQ